MTATVRQRPLVAVPIRRQDARAMQTRAAQLADDASKLVRWYKGIAADYREAQRVRSPATSTAVLGELLTVRQAMGAAVLTAEARQAARAPRAVAGAAHMSRRKRSYLTVTDQFCGAGGSSLGAVKAGLELRGGVEFINDEFYAPESPEHRWRRMRAWVESQIRVPGSTTPKERP